MTTPEEIPETPETQEITLDDELENLQLGLESIVACLTEQTKKVREFQAEYKRFQNKIKKTLKKHRKKEGKKKGKAPEHGFNAKVFISDQLADFLELPRGTLIRRPEVTSLFNKYANEHNLKAADNKGIFAPNAKMKKLLGPATHPLKKSKPDQLGYGIFNLQIYLKPHFTAPPKTDVV